MRRTIRGIVWILIAILTPRTAFACLWDTDTLANEAKGLPEVVQVVTGRFERNPPLFYEMRLKRVTAELDREPGLLGDYDDAAVACDRLSRDDDSIVWMQKKRARLEKMDRTEPENKNHWYRYYANIGTFRAHRWLQAGADRKRIVEVKEARAEIAKAIEINTTIRSLQRSSTCCSTFARTSSCTGPADIAPRSQGRASIRAPCRIRCPSGSASAEPPNRLPAPERWACR